MTPVLQRKLPRELYQTAALLLLVLLLLFWFGSEGPAVSFASELNNLFGFCDSKGSKLTKFITVNSM